MKVPKQVSIFLKDLVGRSKKTIKNYESFAQVFWSYVDKQVKDITVKDIMKFLKWGVDKQGWKLSTMRQYAVLAQRFMSEFKDDTFMKDLKKEIRGLPRPRKYASLYEGVYVPGDRMDEFIEKAPNEELGIVYTMILKWGLRLDEALNMKFADINAKLAKITVRGKGAGFEKKIRNVWVDRESLGKILGFGGCNGNEISGSSPLKLKGKIVHVAPRTVEVNWKKTAKKLKLPKWKKLTPHDGRHSYAIDFLLKRKKQGMAALTLLKNQLGHSDINTTMIYLDIAGTEARDIFDAGVKNESS